MKDFMNDFKSVNVGWDGYDVGSDGYDNFLEEMASLPTESADSFPKIRIWHW